MKIMVFDVPAENGGALTILKQYYSQAHEDVNNEWFFVLSTPEFANQENVRVINYPWIKKSWFHRLYFDYFIASKLVTDNRIDEVISLQNVLIPHVKVRQTLYLHQLLPFIDKRFGIFENFRFWVYQNLIGRLIYKSLKNADKIIVQTNWMKKACLKVMNDKEINIEIQYPKLHIEAKGKYQKNPLESYFFYPASSLIYKNHQVIIHAVKSLCDEGKCNLRVAFTLDNNENKHTKSMYGYIKKYNLPIDFIGKLTYEEVHRYYNKAILIFPSYIETFGLPLLEARIHNSPIIAADLPFAREILDGYESVEYFNYASNQELKTMMEKFV